MAVSAERERQIRQAWGDHGSRWSGLGPLVVDGHPSMTVPKQSKPRPPPDSFKFELRSSVVDGKPANLIFCEGVIVQIFETKASCSRFNRIAPARAALRGAMEGEDIGV